MKNKKIFPQFINLPWWERGLPDLPLISQIDGLQVPPVLTPFPFAKYSALAGGWWKAEAEALEYPEGILLVCCGPNP